MFTKNTAKRRPHYALLAFILALPVLGYGIMHMLVYVLPLTGSNPNDQNIGNQLVYAVIITALGLLVPWWVVKLGVHKAALNDPSEHELEFRDMAKDKDEIARQ